MPTAQHPSASRIPQPSELPAIVGDPDVLADLAWESGYKPGGIEDYLVEDRPVLGLRVNSFTDRTIVTLQWQHVAFDALGLQYVVEAWAASLWGKMDEIPTPCNPEKNPFDALGNGSRPTHEKHILADQRVKLTGLLRWGLGYGVDMLVRAKENRMVCVPKSYWMPEMQRALEELRAEAILNGQDPSKVFLTENDIITAWLLKCIVQSMDMNRKRLVSRGRINPLASTLLITIFPTIRWLHQSPCPFEKPSKTTLSRLLVRAHTLAMLLDGQMSSSPPETLPPNLLAGWRARCVVPSTSKAPKASTKLTTRCYASLD